MKNPDKITKPGRVIGRWLAARWQHLCGPVTVLMAGMMLAGNARPQVDAARMNWLVAEETDTAFVRGMMNATPLGVSFGRLPGAPAH